MPVLQWQRGSTRWDSRGDPSALSPSISMINSSLVFSAVWPQYQLVRPASTKSSCHSSSHFHDHPILCQSWLAHKAGLLRCILLQCILPFSFTPLIITPFAFLALRLFISSSEKEPRFQSEREQGSRVILTAVVARPPQLNKAWLITQLRPDLHLLCLHANSNS